MTYSAIIEEKGTKGQKDTSKMAKEMAKEMAKVDFPAFARHFLAWRNSLLQISLEKRLQCDYVV